jgi:DNA-binding CsgD family transcriptional regulator
MDLLERDVALRELDAALADTTQGRGGRIVLVSGEAGIGKSALVQHFARQHTGTQRVLSGACDALSTPRPLGPLHDIAEQVDGELNALLVAGADRGAVFSAALAELQRAPTIAVFEDVHWADEATLDLLRFLGRRIARTTALLILTYRDDELGSSHPVRALLGDFTSPTTVRLPLGPFSELAVRVLVGHRAIDAHALHRRTGGNPFFVTESLANPGAGLPSTVRDAVLGRVARLSGSAHTVLEAAAVLGPRIELWLLAEVVPDDVSAADECLAGGVLVMHGDGLAFRHELARQTVLEHIAPLRRVGLHRRALYALRTVPRGAPDLSRLAHHARGAQDCAALLSYAPAAAREAAQAAAHREAATLYALALPCAEDLAPPEQAALYAAHGAACFFIADGPAAIASRQKAVALWRAAERPLQQGEQLALLALAFSSTARHEEARQSSQAAIDLLETQPPGRELALAYRISGLLCLYDHDIPQTITLAQRAVEVAERAGDLRIEAMAYDTLGLALLEVDFDRGRQHLEHVREIGLRLGFDSDVARTYGEFGWNCVRLFRLDEAEQSLAAGLDFTAERDLDFYRYFMLGSMALAHLSRGRWSEAATAAEEVLRAPAISTNARMTALAARGRLHARQGVYTLSTALDEALDLALRLDVFNAVAPIRAARAEAAWLAGDAERALFEADSVYAAAVQKRPAWLVGELALWRWRAGVVEPIPVYIAAPYALQIRGNWRAAADAWRRLGCPYEEASALADGDLSAQEQALAIFDRLGARPAAAELRRAMRTRGVVRQRRGPRESTRANHFGLTLRQLEILSLLAEGLSNAEIAMRLSITPKTAEHHVAAVLAKLDVPSRQAAVRKYRLAAT